MSRAYLASAHMHISDLEKWSSPTINQLLLSQLYGISLYMSQFELLSTKNDEFRV
jgi:hypothetical protein